MKHLFIPYELAVIAKEKGFNEPCFGFYRKSGGNIELGSLARFSTEYTHIISAPLYQQIVDWFREKHGINVEVKLYSRKFNVQNNDSNMIFNITVIHPIAGDCVSRGRYSDYYEALNKAIEEAFKLI